MLLLRKGVAFPEREAIPLVLLSEGMYCQKLPEAGKTYKTCKIHHSKVPDAPQEAPGGPQVDPRRPPGGFQEHPQVAHAREVGSII